MQRYDFHIHSLLTEGELVPSEIAQRCNVLDYGGIAITDHVDGSNLKFVLESLVPACRELDENFELNVFAGVELTHIPPTLIEKYVMKARDLGAQVILVHGETIVEPVSKGTNTAALKTLGVDILAHPGLVSKQDAELAKKNEIFLELTSRKGHSLANGHVAKRGILAGADLLLNSDAHSPDDLISMHQAESIARGSGLSESEADMALYKNPKKLLDRIGRN